MLDTRHHYRSDRTEDPTSKAAQKRLAHRRERMRVRESIRRGDDETAALYAERKQIRKPH